MSPRPWAGEPVPFTLIGGYLGAGKTTIVNHLLASATGRRLVVLVNDVGAVNVDAALIADHDGATLTLTNGCVCCAIADDFAQTIEQVRSLPDRPDQVVMELSGVGEPARVAPWASTTGFRLDGIVVAADADQIIALADRRFVGETVREQLRTADIVLLTKTDLTADTGAAARRFVSTSTDAPVVATIDGRVPVDVVLGVDRRWPAPVPLGEPVPAPTVETVAVGAVSIAEVEALVAGLGADVLRAKGLVRCTDRDAPIEVHVVGRRRSVRERPDLAAERASDALVVIR